MQGQILLISGPSGSGKSTLINKLIKEKRDEVYFSISSTTREKRENEVDGVNYHFISEREFKDGIERGEFLEWAYVHKNYYGTSLKPAMEAIKNKKIVIFDIDVQGYKIAKSKIPELITSVFITTKNKMELEKRLILRNSDSKSSIEKRLENASIEINDIGLYNYLLFNDNIDACYLKLCSIYNSLKCKTDKMNIKHIIQNW